MGLPNLKSKLSQHRFEINHILVFFIVVIMIQVVLVFFQGSLLTNFLNDAQRWFQKYHAERIAIVTSASLENLFENQQRIRAEGKIDETQTIYSVNVFFKQLVMQRNIEEISLILLKDDDPVAYERVGKSQRVQLARTQPPISDGSLGFTQHETRDEAAWAGEHQRLRIRQRQPVAIEGLHGKRFEAHEGKFRLIRRRGPTDRRW